MIRSRLLTTSLLLTLLVSLHACTPPAPSRVSGEAPEPTSSLTQADPSAQIAEYVVEIFEDSRGNLWFGTVSEGAVRFDGEKLTYFTVANGLCNNTVASIAEDKEGNLWFGTHEGASRYDGKTFTNFASAQGLPGAGCQILVTRKGDIWAGTNMGAFRFNGSSFSRFDLPQPSLGTLSYKWVAGKVWSLTEDRQGNIWFGRDGYGACRYDGTSFTLFTQADGLCSNNVSRIIEDRQGNLWFGSLSSDFPQYVNEGGISRYDGETFVRYPEIEGLHENDIYTIYEDKSGGIWLCAIGHGAYRYDGKSFAFFNESDRPDLIRNFGIQSILEDRKGRLWFGFSGGLFRFQGASFENVTVRGPWR